MRYLSIFILSLVVIMEQKTFIYNNNEYIFKYNSRDVSELWCIDEIVRDNDYMLDKFVNNINKHFIDIGANCGVATIILAKQNPNSKIYAFEPDPNVFKVLEENVNANKLSNVILFNYAVSNPENKNIDLCFHPSYSGGNTTYADKSNICSFFNNNYIKIITVQCISLDEVLVNYSINNVELLKIDCEGAEYDIIYTSNSIKENKIKNIVGEFHNLAYNNRVKNTADELIQYTKPYISGIFNIRTLNV